MMMSERRPLTFCTMLLRSVFRTVLTLTKAWLTSGTWQTGKRSRVNLDIFLTVKMFQYYMAYCFLSPWRSQHWFPAGTLWSGWCYRYEIQLRWRRRGRTGCWRERPLPWQAGLKLPHPVLQHLQGWADVLQGLFGLPHGYKQQEIWHTVKLFFYWDNSMLGFFTLTTEAQPTEENYNKKLFPT